jgi:hypothetical protein
VEGNPIMWRNSRNTHRVPWWLALVLAPLLAVAVTAQEAPRTWRVDYNHTGGVGQEIFSLDRVVVEPLPWPGNPASNIDTTGEGKYRFEVVNAEGQLVYSRGFNSIYGEWETTAEAGKIHRTFGESLRFPAPDGPVDVVVEKRNDDNVGFHELWRTYIDPENMFIDTAAPPKQDLLEIEHHGTPRDKVDVLLLGDGYTAEECKTKFLHDARHLRDVFFAHEPFKHRRDDFNIWGLCPPSPQSGVSRPSTGIHLWTPVHATYDAFGSERYLLTFDNRAWRDIAAWAPYEFVEILANNETYGGGGIFNLYATVAVDGDWADYVFIHEFGHHFAGLADEYFTSPVAYEPPAKVVEPWEPNVTAHPDRAHLKWADLVDSATPLPTPWPKEEFEEYSRGIQERRKQIRAERQPESVMSALFREERAHEEAMFSAAQYSGTVGAFQGANYDSKAFYRPQMDCIMFTRDRVPFCAVCQRALERIIDLYAPPS